MSRITLLIAIIITCLFVTASTSFAASNYLDAKTMKAALKTATPVEKGFIDRTLRLVDEGTLPKKLVVSTFLWARRKPKNKFQYFERGMKIRAARIGVRL